MFAVASISTVELPVNFKTAREIGLTIPQAVRLRVDEVLQRWISLCANRATCSRQIDAANVCFLKF
jgi:hypothetical protein